MTDEHATPPPEAPPIRSRDFLSAAWLGYRERNVKVRFDLDADAACFLFPDTPEVRADLEALRNDDAHPELRQWEHTKKALRAVIQDAKERAEQELPHEQRLARIWAQRQQDNARIAQQNRNPLREERRRLQAEADARLVRANVEAAQRAQLVGRRPTENNGDGDGAESEGE